MNIGTKEWNKYTKGSTVRQDFQVDFGIALPLPLPLLNYSIKLDWKDGKCPDYTIAGEVVPFVTAISVTSASMDTLLELPMLAIRERQVVQPTSCSNATRG